MLLRFLSSGLALGLASALTAQAQTWQSAAVLPTSTTGSATVSKLVADGAGGYLLAGKFTGTLTLGSFALTSAGGLDLFVARLNAAGQWAQAVRAGGTGDDTAAGLAVDATGLATIVGSFASPVINFGPTTLTNADASAVPGTDLFVARLSTAGQWTQAVRAGGTSDETADRVAIDPNGTAVVGGSFFGSSLSLGSYTLSGTITGGAPFVARLSSAGAWSQAVKIQSSGAPVYLGELAVDGSGTAVVSGMYLSGGTLTLGSYSLSSPLANALYVARLSRNGTWTQAAQAAGPNGTTIARRLVLDAAGNVIIAGETNSSSASFGSYAVGSAADAKGQRSFLTFVARLSTTGTWTQVAQATISPGSSPDANQSNYIGGLALDASGNVWLGGIFNSPTLTLGSLTLANSNPNPVQTLRFDGYVARLSSTGTWAFATPATNASPEALVLSGSNLMVAGNLSAPATFGSLTVVPNAVPAAFVASLGGGALALAPAAATSPACVAAPNPAGGYAVLTLPATASARPVLLLDALGREVRRFVLPAQATSLPLDLTGLPGATYLLRCGFTVSRLVVN